MQGRLELWLCWVSDGWGHTLDRAASLCIFAALYLNLNLMSTLEVSLVPFIFPLSNIAPLNTSPFLLLTFSLTGLLKTCSRTQLARAARVQAPTVGSVGICLGIGCGLPWSNSHTVETFKISRVCRLWGEATRFVWVVHSSGSPKHNLVQVLTIVRWNAQEAIDSGWASTVGPSRPTQSRVIQTKTPCQPPVLSESWEGDLMLRMWWWELHRGFVQLSKERELFSDRLPGGKGKGVLSPRCLLRPVST